MAGIEVVTVDAGEFDRMGPRVVERLFRTCGAGGRWKDGAVDCVKGSRKV